MTLTSHNYLELSSAEGIVTGFVQAGAMFDPTAAPYSTTSPQQYTPMVCDRSAGICTPGTPVPTNVVNPPYCTAPFSESYVEPPSGYWDYSNIKCSRYMEPDMGLKRTPSYVFISTLMHERKFEMTQCSANSPTCNPTTANVSIVGNSCSCKTVTQLLCDQP